MHRMRFKTTRVGSVLFVLTAMACGGSEGSTAPATPATPAPASAREHAQTSEIEPVSPSPVADLQGAATQPEEPEIPSDTVALTARMHPRALDIPRTRAGRTSRFMFDESHRGWFARLPHGRQRLLTPVYGEGKVYLGGGFSSHAMFAYDARTGEREWSASAPDGGPSAAILDDGKIVFNTESCTLFAVDAQTGRRLWSRWLGDPLMSQPAAGGGLVFSGHVIDGQSPGGITPGTTGYGTGEGRRYGFTAMNLSNGAPRWTRRIPADVINAPVLVDGDVFFATMDGTLFRLDQRTGRVRWRRRIHATSAPWIEGDEVHVTVRSRANGHVRENAVVLAKSDGQTVREHDPVLARFVRGRPDPDVQRGWAYEGSRASIVDGRIYQTIGNEVHCRDAEDGELLWRRRYTNETRVRPASAPAVAGSQLVFGTEDGTLFGLDIDTGMTTWAYDVGEPIAAQPTVAHGWVYASTTRGGLVALEVSDVSFDGWHMWGGNAQHNGQVIGTTPPAEEDRPSEGTLALGGDARDGEAAGFVLEGTEVQAQVHGFVARVEVEQTFSNPYDRAVEAVYSFPLPDDAAVDAMELRTGGRVIRAHIRRRHQAREQYRQARDEGLLASLLEQERANLFRQSVANIRPGEDVRIALSYTQVLPYEEGSYRFVYPMVAGPRYQPDGSEEGGAFRQVVLAPGGERPDRVRVSIDADLGLRLEGVESPTHQLRVDAREGHAVHVGLAGAVRPDRDLDVRFEVAGEVPTLSTHTSPPTGEGEMSEDGHLALSLHPRRHVSDAEVMPRELVFVVDTSSSMHGRPIALAKAAMVRTLRGMRPTDTFRVLTFSDTTSALSDAPLTATRANIDRGVAFVENMRALGATDMVRGIRAALEPEGEDDRMRVVMLMSDGFIGNETDVFREVHARLGHARVFAFGVGSAVNRYLLSRVAEHGRGDMQVVTLDESPEEAADAFHERIARPYLTDITIDWGELEVSGVYPRRAPDLFADRPLVVHARYARGGSGEVTVRGRIAGQAFEQRVQVTLPETGPRDEALASIWARTRIRDLMTAMALQPNEALQEEVTQLGLRHHLLTRWTAFIAVDRQRRTEPVDGPIRVHQPSAVPAGHSAPRREPPQEQAYNAPRTADPPPLLNAFDGDVAQPQAAPSRAAIRQTRRPRAGSLQRTPGAAERCRQLATRPDGSFDAAAYAACMRSAGAQKGGRRVQDRRAAASERHAPPAVHRRRRRWAAPVR